MAVKAWRTPRQIDPLSILGARAKRSARLRPSDARARWRRIARRRYASRRRTRGAHLGLDHVTMGPDRRRESHQAGRHVRLELHVRARASTTVDERRDGNGEE